MYFLLKILFQDITILNIQIFIKQLDFYKAKLIIYFVKIIQKITIYM